MSLPGLPVLNYRVLASANTLEFWWQAPIDDGGRQINNYTLWCSSIPYSTVIASSTFYAKVSTLTNTQNYTFQLAASNLVGTGPFNVYPIAQPGNQPAGIANLAVSSINGNSANVVWTFANNANEATNKFFAISVYPSTSTASVSSFMMAAYPNQRSQLISNLSTMYYNFVVQPINDAGYAFPNVSTLKLITQPPPPARVSGIQLWLDANDPLGNSSVPSNGTTISSWVDKSVNLYSAVAVGTPTLATNSQNALPGVSITPGNYSKSTIPAGTFINALSAFVVYKSTGANNTANAIITRSSSTTSPNLGNPLDIQTNLYLIGNNNAAQFVSNYNCYNTSTSIFNININQTAVTLSLFNNGTAITGIANRFGGALPTWTASDLGNLLVIGGRADNGSYNNAYYYEVLVYNTNLSTQDRQLVEGYLAWKWGLQGSLPAGHPYLSAAPV